MSAPPRRRATYDDLCRVPRHLVAEIVAGELISSPRPALRHARAASRLGASLDGPFDRGSVGPGGWIILDQPEVHLGRDILVPDLAGWRRERMPAIPDRPFTDLPPDWVCEVLSPSTEPDDRAGKMPIYAREGVSHLWLLNPLSRTLEVFRLQAGQWLLLVTHRGDAPVRVEPFEAAELDLSLLWG